MLSLDSPCSCVSWTYSNPVPGGLHTHDFLELFWVEQGRGLHRINGYDRLMETGYLSLIRAEDCHTFSALEPGHRVRFINFAFPRSVWTQVRRQFFNGQGHFFDRPDFAEREYQLEPEELQRLRLSASDLLAGIWNKLNADSFLRAVLSLLVSKEHRKSTKVNLPEWLALTLRNMERHPHFTGGVPEFIRLSGRTHEHVARVCRRLLQQSPHQLVNEIRLRRAVSQLIATDMKIVDVAGEAGFENLGYFYKLFQRKHGLTPRIYREKFRVTSSNN